MLRDRPAEAIPGIGRQRAKVTNARGWMTAWDIATANPEELRMHFGKGGPELQAELQGRIISPVTTEQDPQQSISRARSFRATSNKDILWAHVLQHLQYVTLKMRRQGLAAGGISVWLRNADYASDSEGLRLPQLHDTEEQLLPYVRACFEKCHGELVGPRCTQTGLSLWGLLPRGPRQISLFDPSDTVDREESLQESLDRLRDRFGKNTIHRGSAFIARERGGRKAPLPMAEEG
jgi:DNA polymerase V